MKNLLIFLGSILIVLTFFNCKKEDKCLCTEEFAPVCGVDGVEYGNACLADCAGVEYTQGFCSLEVDAKVLDLGDPAADGCGWVLEIETNGTPANYRPDNLPDDMKVHQLDVKLVYENTFETDHCGLSPNMIPMIMIVSIDEL